MRRRLIVFLKPPVLGRVKTRLAGEIGDEMALSAYRAMVDDLVENLVPGSWENIFYVAGEASGLSFHDTIRKQSGGDLGAKMQSALSEAFSDGMDQAVLIGSDIPQINSCLIEQYFTKLENHPMVVGPTEDGGYYLIGFQGGVDMAPVFQDILWSTDTVLRQTLERADESGLLVYQGRKLRDIDFLADLDALLSQPGAAERLPRLYRLFGGVG